MPSLDIDVTDAFPFGYRELTYKPALGYPALGSETLFGQKYQEFPFRVFRESTSRNSPVAGGPKIPSPFKLRLLQWYSEKPKITDFIAAKKIKRAFHLAKVDWRKRRPVRNLSDIPEGWKLVEVSSGKYARVMVGTDPGTKLAIFRNQPLTVKRLRPSNRAWRRKSPNVALKANVNDLRYWKQSGDLQGNVFCGISDNATGTWNSNPPLGGGTSYGNIFLDGFATDDDLSVLGFSNVWNLDIGSPVDPQNLEIEYASQIDELSYIALKRHYAKIQNQKIDLATETSQAMQTVNMIIDLSARLGKAFLALKKLNVILAFETLFPTSRKELANDYLVYQYGIKPLLGDVVGAAEHLAEYVLKARPVKSNGHAQKSYNFDETFDFNDGHIVNRRLIRKKVDIRVKYSSIFEISDDLARQAAQLGFTNPANVIWELVPFSFVADWFLPIGDFLSALTSVNGLAIKESYKTVFITVTEFYQESRGRLDEGSGTVTESPIDQYPLYTIKGSDRIADDGYLWWRQGHRQSSCSTLYCHREVIPLPDVPTPRFKSPISTVHLAEALALFSQLREK